MLIVLEGLDGCGKTTQQERLVQRLRASGYSAVALSFPNRATPVGRLIDAYLNGVAGTEVFTLEVAALLFAANRAELAPALRRELDRGAVVVLSRYWPANVAYMAAKRSSGPGRESLVEWLIGLDARLPRPDLVLVLDVDPSEIQVARLRERRASGSLDRHERDPIYQVQVRDLYRHLAERFGWTVLDGSRSLGEVEDDIWSFVQPLLRSRERQSASSDADPCAPGAE